MKILYIGLKYDYGKPEGGPSYEAMNIEAGFRDCAADGMFELDVLNPDDMTKDQLRQRMFEKIQSPTPPDAIFHVPFNEHIDVPHDMMALAKLRDVVCIEWDCDASWRFENFIVGRRDLYTHFITTHSSTVPWYDAHNMRVIRSQWGGSPLYKRDTSVEKVYDVTFIGQKHGIRPQIVNAIHAAGINLHLFGNYWDGGFRNAHGYISFEGMVRVFQQSKICLNLSAPWSGTGLSQIKGRHFEIPQLGGFQLSTPADDLENYFEDRKEIVIATSLPNLIKEMRYFLSHPDEREAIAEAGHQRTLKEYQWKHRFQKIFSEIGLL